MDIFICQTCGHIEFNKIPEKCQICGVEKEKYIQNNNIFKESMERSPEAEVKHVPDISAKKVCGLIPESTCADVIVRIGKVLHPMEEKHYIRFIDCYQDEKYIGRMLLSPINLNPAACFHLKKNVGKITIVENCNIHGYWMSSITL
ncbi:MAG: desulfoferrodoxin family protein [bacterium]